MSKYKVAFIDEFSEDVREFQRFAGDTFDVVPITPLSDLDELVAVILESHVQAVVIDHNLIEYDKTESINYLGNDVVDKINEVLLDFPVFVLTSYDEDAIDRNDDARIVYEKKLMYASKEQTELFEMGLKFKRLISKQVEKYQRKIEDNEKELLKLINISKERALTEPEEKELMRLDNFIEMSLNKKGIVPEYLKQSTHSERLERLLEKVDNLLKKFDDE
ncbi:MAG: hypothetical protein K8R58_11745 [Bacteroidales bacterium]|nr:hypothetical protein [Bacteroidales bacterium]